MANSVFSLNSAQCNQIKRSARRMHATHDACDAVAKNVTGGFRHSAATLSKYQRTVVRRNDMRQ